MSDDVFTLMALFLIFMMIGITIGTLIMPDEKQEPIACQKVEHAVNTTNASMMIGDIKVDCSVSMH